MGRIAVVCAVVMMGLEMHGVAQVAAPAPAATVAEKADVGGKADWQADVDRRRSALIARNGLGTDAALRDRLLKMKDEDQAARGMAAGAGKDGDKLAIAANLVEVDAGLTTELKAIVADKGWPTIALVGYDASNAAMVVLTHTRDHAWQLGLLPQLEELADAGKIDGSALAVVIDKELVSEGKLQRYGTQFKYVDGGMAMYGVEDPGGLDARRAQVFLPPMAVYKEMLGKMYHLKATDKVVMAVRP